MASGVGAGPESSGATDRRRAPISPWGPLTLVIVAALSVVTWAVVRQGVQRESDAILTNNAQQIEILLQSTLTSLQGQLRSTAFVTASAGNSPAVFAQQAGALRTRPVVSVAVVDISGTGARVMAAAGPDMQQGTTLPADLAAVAHSGATALSSGFAHHGSTLLVAFAAAPTLTPDTVAIETTPIDQSKATPNQAGPYNKVYVNVYGSPTARQDTLVLSTYGPKPLPKPVATAPLKVGNVSWLIAVSPREPVIGGTAAAAPWLLLGIGLFVAVLLAVFVELLARRQRYARALVEERTAELVEAQRSLLRQERLAAIGEMATVVSHELRNPLSAVVNDLFLVRHALDDHVSTDVERHLGNAEREIFRAARLSEDLLAYTREREPQRSQVDVGALVAEVLESSPPPQGVDVDVSGAVQLQADPALMAQVLTNLLTNAYQAMPGGGTIRVTAGRSGDTAVVSVEDAGPGFDPEIAGRLFDPFFTTKDGGTGLGLAIVQRLVEAHDGRVSMENVPGGGARVTLELPDAGVRA